MPYLCREIPQLKKFGPKPNPEKVKPPKTEEAEKDEGAQTKKQRTENDPCDHVS